MRKMFAVVIALLLLISTVSAEGIDLTSMSTLELTELIDSIQLELSSRYDAKVENRIGRGTYIVGKDIKEGMFDFLCLETTMTGGLPNNDVIIYSVNSDTNEIGEILQITNFVDIGQHVIVNLTSGTALSIDGCSGILTETTPSWAP